MVEDGKGGGKDSLSCGGASDLEGEGASTAARHQRGRSGYFVQAWMEARGLGKLL